MKKAIIALSAVVMATVCNAAAVTWQSGAVYKATDIETKVGKDVTDYLVTVYFYSDAAGTTELSGLTGDLSLGTSGNGSKYSGTVEGFENSKTYYTQIVITTSGYEAKSDVVSFTTKGTGGTDLDFSDGTGFTGFSGFSTSTAGAWTAVPEPTSGLLVLLGMAGLALKRKRA